MCEIVHAHDLLSLATAALDCLAAATALSRVAGCPSTALPAAVRAPARRDERVGGGLETRRSTDVGDEGREIRDDVSSSLRDGKLASIFRHRRRGVVRTRVLPRAALRRRAHRCAAIAQLRAELDADEARRVGARPAPRLRQRRRDLRKSVWIDGKRGRVRGTNGAVPNIAVHASESVASRRRRRITRGEPWIQIEFTRRARHRSRRRERRRRRSFSILIARPLTTL